ncbi:hypothetical protein STENM327S_05243 [Streptomyces tendae]
MSAVWLVAQELDAALVRLLQDDGDYETVAELLRFADDAKTVVSAVGSAMMTFIGVVFSISLVAVQMASGQFTPRVVRLFVRSRITKATFAVFLATFVLTLLVLTSYDSHADPRTATSVPLVQSVLTLAMVALSLLLFVMYVNATLRLMRVSHVIARIAAESFRVAALMPVPADGGGAPGLGPVTAWVAHDGQGGVLRDVHVARLVRVALVRWCCGWCLGSVTSWCRAPRSWQCTAGRLRRAGRCGTPCPWGWSAPSTRTWRSGCASCPTSGRRALSPAVNDPTTAVQALDRVVQILATLSRRPLDAVLHRDRRGVVRLVQPVPGWAELVDLGFAEVRACAVGSPQVTRRLVAGLDDLLLLVPPERRAPLLRHRELLRQAVERTAPTPADRAFARRPDRQGIG